MNGQLLIVDDEKNMRLTLSDILTDEGYAVETASSGEEAVERCAERSFDVILMDVRMPGIDGVEAFRRIRQRRTRARVIFMSAYTTQDLQQAVLDEGALAFLSKPLDVESVLKVIRQARDTSILVVVEDLAAAGRLVAFIKDRGYWVTVASQPDEALDLCEQVRFDVVMLEVSLPDMNGLALYLAIKKIIPTSVTIMMSNPIDAEEALAREAVKQTAYTFLRKPVDLAHMERLLDRLTAQRISGYLRKPGLPSA